MKTATIHSSCECQARLGANLDANKYVLRGWARDPRGREQSAPAQSIGASGVRFDVAWSCPLCTRNVLRSFDSSALVWRETAAGQTRPSP
jgi:hypothetical protein